MSEWISSEAGAHADTDTLKSEHNKLKALVDPVEFRKSEAAKRPDLVKMLQENLEQSKNAAAMIKSAMEKAAEEAKAAAKADDDAAVATEPENGNDRDNDEDKTNENAPSSSSPVPQAPVLSDEDLASVTSKHDEIAAWLAEKQAAQDRLAENVNPVLLSTDIEMKARELNEVALAMLQRQMKAQQRQQQEQAKLEKERQRLQKKKEKEEKEKEKEKEAENNEQKEKEKAEAEAEAEAEENQKTEQEENTKKKPIKHEEL